MAGEQPLRIYTDGACSGNPGPGGWAWASSREHFGSGGEAATTNNKMELTAVLRAIEDNPGRPLTLVMDSTYVKDGLQKWSVNWIRNGWRTKAGEPVKNREIWEPLVAARDARRDELTFEWVKGHSGDRMNDLVDELAVVERDRFRQAVGPTPGAPGGGGKISDLPIEEQRAEKRRRDGRIPAGHLLLVLGLSPDALGGWEANPVADDVRRRLQEWIDAQAQLHPDLVVLTGLRPGAEVLAAEAAIRADVPYAVVLAFPGMEAKQAPATQARFRDLVGRASSVANFHKKVPTDRAGFAANLKQRERWLVDAADQAVLVWDEQDARLDATFSTLEKAFGDDLLVIRP
ncbi:RNase H family protein [Aquihabitans sp. G128]|uniref:RNase H family protein n=2 Tax=Aquihabitans sp. G128 TaxID=2849779 RepID=UPI0020B3334E|nr:RNase H family protein [Aquihabitans sp. G128]